MDLRALTQLALKLAGLYLLVSMLSSLPSLLAVPAEYIPMGVITYLLQAMVGLALLGFPGVIINSVLRIKGGDLQGSVSASAMLRVGMVLMGCYFASTAMYGMAYVWTKSQWFYMGSHALALMPGDKASLFAEGVRLTLGLLLCFGAGRMLRRIEDRHMAHRGD